MSSGSGVEMSGWNKGRIGLCTLVSLAGTPRSIFGLMLTRRRLLDRGNGLDGGGGKV